MENRRAMSVKRSFGIAGRTRGVAKRGGQALIEDGPGEVVALCSEQFLVAESIGHSGRHVRAIGKRDPTPNAAALPDEFFDQRHETQIKEDVAILGMIDDVY